MMTSYEIRYNIHEINATKTAEWTGIVFQKHFEIEDVLAYFLQLRFPL
jgi:hypothetical protein